MNTLTLALAIAGKDLRIEWRQRTGLVTAAAFAVLVLLIFTFAREQGSVAPHQMASSVLWVMLALASLLSLNRGFLLEREQGALDGILLTPVSRGAIYWGKWLANLAFVVLVEAVALPLWMLFFNVPLGLDLLGVAGVVVLASAGFAAVGTLFAAMSVRTRYAELLLPVLLLPFLVPSVFFAAQATSRILTHRPADEVLGWLTLLAAFDLVFLTLGTMLFPAVMDE